MSNIEPFSPGTFADVALSYVAAGFSPIPVRGKSEPPKGATGYQGTVTEEKVNEWVANAFWKDENIGLRSDGTWIGIDVDAYDDKQGDSQLAELEQALGELPLTPSSTSRGIDSPSRIYFFEVPEGLHFLDHAAPDIEIIQTSHRYAVVWPSKHPVTGNTYQFYDAEGQPLPGIPNREDFERLPEAWIEYLFTDPAKPTEGFSGTVEQWLQSTNQDLPNGKVRAWMATIPTDKFDHTDVIRVTYSIVRMGAEGEPGIRQALEYLYNAWVKPPYDTDKHVKELSVSIQGAIRKAGSFEISEEMLPDFFEASRIAGKMEKRLERMILEGTDLGPVTFELLTKGLDVRDVAALTWPGPGKKLFGNDFAGFWEQTLDLHVQWQSARAVGEAEKKGRESQYVLLTAEERESIADAENWSTRYMRYAKTKVPDGYLNEPYHRLSAWIAASMSYGIMGRIEFDPEPLALNIYGTALGLSSTGKSQATNVCMGFIKAFHVGEYGWNMGSNASAAAMQRHLIEQDNMPTLFNDDEASGPFSAFYDQKGFQDLPARITKWYEGEVTPMFRTMDKDLNGKAARAHLNMYMMGTPSEVFKVIEADHFKSGFLARMMWAIGEPPRSSTSEYRVKVRSKHTAELGYDPALADMVTQVKALTERLRAMAGPNGYVPLFPSDAALERMHVAGNRILNVFRGHKMWDVLEPISKRMMDIVWKCAGLLALDASRATIELEDVLFVLAETENWLMAAEVVVGSLNSSAHSRQTTELMTWLGRIKQSNVPIHRVYQMLEHLDQHQANKLIEALIAQRKIKRWKEGDNVFIKVIREEGEES